MKREAITQAIDSLKKGETPRFTIEDVPVFAKVEPSADVHLNEEALQDLCASLDESDIPTLERALDAMDSDEVAWLGFKVVYDAKRAVENIDNDVTALFGPYGSADGKPLLFFCNEDGEITASREVSDRDIFQIKDIARGPSMHNEQFEGLSWASIPLFSPKRVWLLGASDVASEVAQLARHVGFDVVAVDFDEAYLNALRFPECKRILLETSDFDGLDHLAADSSDYVCVLTRGHVHDHVACLWAVRNNVHYVGMMGCSAKNDRIHELVSEAGMTEEQWASIKRPIGLKFGAKTPAELAVSIVAELIDVRYKERYSDEARAKHDESLGR